MRSTHEHHEHAFGARRRGFRRGFEPEPAPTRRRGGMPPFRPFPGHPLAPRWERIAQDVDPDDVNLRDAAGLLMGAMFQVANAAAPAQRARAIDVINEARRELYAILGEVEPPEA